MSIDTIALKLSRDDSLRLLKALDEQDNPWELHYAGAGIFNVVIDGTLTVHQLDLEAAGGWCMRTHVEI